jgi:predicted ATPase/transcriptional regulator with XRE-family HTH domain
MSADPGTAFGALLRRYREAAGLSQEDLAERAGLTAKGIGALERGERQHPQPRTLQQLAAALHLSEQDRATFIAAVARHTSAGPDLDLTPAAPPELAVPTLPVPLTPLVGRDQEMAAVTALLQQGKVRLLTLTGPGGVGKTRLALEVARSVAPAFEDGSIMVALAPLSDPALVLPTIAHVLGVRESPGRPLREALQATLQARRRLLLLDNCEHVLSGMTDVAALLETCPGLVVLATSRAALGLRGERLYPVKPLAIPALEHLPLVADIAAVAAVALFVQRACAAVPSFVLDQAHAAAVAAICRRLDGLPLAIELAAARVKLLDPTGLLARLDRSLPLLVGGARDLPERQRTMRDTIAWSYRLLGETEQKVFRQLGVFTGGWTLEAAEAVCGDGVSVLDALDALLDGSLINRLMQEDEPRFTMLETIRAYALEQLAAAAEEADTRARHAAYYAALVIGSRARLAGAEQISLLEQLDHEIDNVRGAMDWLLANGEPAQVAEMVWGSWPLWVLRGRIGEGQQWLERALAHRDLAWSASRGRATARLGWLLWIQGRPEQAIPVLEESVVILEAAGDQETLPSALSARGLVALSIGDPAQATACFERALAIGRALPAGALASRNVTTALNGLAQVALGRGDVESAARLFAECEAVARAAQDAFTLSTGLNSQALMAYLQHDDRRVERLLRESVPLSAALRDIWATYQGLVCLAAAAARQKRGTQAARLFGAIEALCEATALRPIDPVIRAVYQEGVATARAALGDAGFAAEWAVGRTFSLHQTVAQLLQDELSGLAPLASS